MHPREGLPHKASYLAAHGAKTTMKMGYAGLGLALILPLAIGSGCSRRAPAEPQTLAADEPAVISPMPDSLPKLNPDPADAIKPLDSGPGIVICDPVVTRGAGSSSPEFGAGCGRWLQLIVGGHGELGKTPQWSSCDAAVAEFPTHNQYLQLTPEQVPALHRIVGVTHAATGNVSGDEKNCTLSFQIWQVPSATALGTPFTATGTYAEILTALPEMAAGMAKALGVASPRIPDRVGESVEELTSMGFPRVPDEHTGGAMSAFHKLAMRLNSPTGAAASGRPTLAAFMYLMYAGALTDGADVESLAGGLARALPENAHVFGEMAWQAYRSRNARVDKLPAAALRKNLKRYPNNAMFNAADAYFHRMGSRYQPAQAAAMRTVRCAPDDPSSWRILHNSIFQEASGIRRSRFIGQMTEQEQAAITRIYEAALPPALKAAEMNPKDPLAWLDVSQNAAFLSETDLANVAFWKAFELDPRNHHTFSWGLQFFQPKWFDDREKLEKLAKLTPEAAARWAPVDRLNAAIQIHLNVSPEIAQQVVRSPMERQRLEEFLKDHAQKHPDH